MTCGTIQYNMAYSTIQYKLALQYNTTYSVLQYNTIQYGI